jgi:hypothetical protein
LIVRKERSLAMQATLIVTIALHVLAGVFWAGSTFVLARTGAAQAQQLFKPQMGAATVAVVTGGALWHLLHRGPAGMQEYILGIGAASALLAAGIQGLGAWTMRQPVAAGPSGAFAPDNRLAASQRIAAVLLAITAACMAAARYA